MDKYLRESVIHIDKVKTYANLGQKLIDYLA